MRKYFINFRITLSTMMIAIWAIAALLGIMVSDWSPAWPPLVVCLTVSISIVLPGVAVALSRRTTLDAAIAQIALTASFWDALFLLPVRFRFATMIVFPASGLIISAIAVRAVLRKRNPSQSGLIRSWDLLGAFCWNSLGALAIFLPAAFALNYYGVVRVR